MNVLKLVLLSCFMCLTISQTSAQEKPITSNDQFMVASRPASSAADFVLWVYPNPFKETFYIRYRGPVRSVELFDDKGDPVEIEISYRFSRIVVYVPNGEPGLYTVVVTFKDGTVLTEPIEKL